MKIIRGVFALIVGGGLQLLVPASAFADQASVVAGCSGGGNGGQLVTGFVNDLRASGASTAMIDQSVADLTVALGEAALGTNSAGARTGIAVCIRNAAAAVSTAQQRAQLEQIALAVENEQNGPFTRVSASGI